MKREFYKNIPGEKIWWTSEEGKRGLLLFSFDKKEVFNFFKDYPHKLTPEQKALFDKENPELAELKKGNRSTYNCG